MIKKRFSLLMAGVLLAGALSACGQKAAAPAPESTAAPVAGSEAASTSAAESETTGTSAAKSETASTPAATESAITHFLFSIHITHTFLAQYAMIHHFTMIRPKNQ